MTKFYKGSIININNLPDYNYSLNIIRIIPNLEEDYHLLGNTSHKALLYFKKYSRKELKNLVILMKKIISLDTDEKNKLDQLMKSIFSPTVSSAIGEDIIFEKIYDENGNTYGKELITGSIFPINTKYSDFDVTYSLVPMDKVYYDMDNDEGYFLIESFKNSKYSYYLVDVNGKEYEIGRNAFGDLKYLSQMEEKGIMVGKKISNMTVCEDPFSFNICLKPKIVFPSNQRIDYTINGESIANDLEVKLYYDKFEKGFGRKKRQKQFENKINNYALSNCLGEIHYVSSSPSVKERVSESSLTKEMQELEFLLFKLKGISIDDYNLLNNEYLEMLNQDNSLLQLNTLSINSIISLQNRAELAFRCHGGDSKKIIAYLEEQINIYLNNYKNGILEKTKLTIDDLDKISSYFLNCKNSYTIKYQNEILRCLALLYFFEIYENKDILTSNDLINSYAIDNIKRIIVIIDTLYEEKIIKSVPSSLYDINNIDELLEYIKKIEINNGLKENHYQLIKKIQQ